MHLLILNLLNCYKLNAQLSKYIFKRDIKIQMDGLSRISKGKLIHSLGLANFHVRFETGSSLTWPNWHAIIRLQIACITVWYGMVSFYLTYN